VAQAMASGSPICSSSVSCSNDFESTHSSSLPARLATLQVRSCLHGSEIARALAACAGLSYVEVSGLSALVDVVVRGETATAFMDGEEVDAISDDALSDDADPREGSSGPGVQPGSRKHSKAWIKFESRVAELKKYKKGVLCVDRTPTLAEKLSSMQLAATVDHGITVCIVRGAHGYAQMLKGLCEIRPGSGARRLCPGPARKPCTRRDQLAMLGVLPGVKEELGMRLLDHFGSVGAVMGANESALIRVVGVKRELAKRLVWLFGCRRGHAGLPPARENVTGAGSGTREVVQGQG